MIVSGVILLIISLFSFITSIVSYGGFLGETFTGILIFLGVGLSLLIAGIVNKKINNEFIIIKNNKSTNSELWQR
ncbi:MAG: hypothetical protein IJ008_01875 [Clostridia bacterium]|nr:hypothetical protein [Clostridia bacterium]